MTKKVLITRPQHDVVVAYLYSWSKELIDLAYANNFEVKDLCGEQANKKEFEKFIDKQKPKLILINGHGTESLICGHSNEVLVQENNSQLLSGAIVHALSCDSASILGKSAVNNGAIAYIGYNMPFTILTDKNYECRPEQDPLAGIFKDPAIEAPKNLIKGNSIKVSFLKAKEKYVESIRSFSSSTAPLEAETIRFALFTNMVCLDLCYKNDDSYCLI